MDALTPRRGTPKRGRLTTVTFGMPQELVDKLTEVARRENRSRAALVTLLLTDSLAIYQPPQPRLQPRRGK